MRHRKALRREARYPWSHSKLEKRAKVSDQAVGTGAYEDSGGSSLGDTLTTCSSVSTLPLLPGLQTQMTKWPTGALYLLISHAPPIRSVPVNSLSSPPGPQPASHTVHLISVPGVTIHWVQSQESPSAPPSPSPGHPPRRNSSSSAPLESAYFSLPLSGIVLTPTIPTAPLPWPPIWPPFLQPHPCQSHLQTAPGCNLYKTRVPLL